MVNDARFGWTRLNWITAPGQRGPERQPERGHHWRSACKAALAGGLATINFNNSALSGFGGAYSEQDLNGTYQGEDTFTWTPGRHTVKLGGMYRSVFFDSSASSFAPNGEFNFDGHYTAQYTNGVTNSATGNAFADFLLDLPDLAQISAIHTNNYRRYAISAVRSGLLEAFPQADGEFRRSLGLCHPGVGSA